MLALLGNQERDLQAAVSQAKERKRKKSSPEKKECILPNCALEWKSFYSCLLLRFSSSFSRPSSTLWVSVLESVGWPYPTLPALPGLRVGLGLVVGELQHLCTFISQCVPRELGQTAVLAVPLGKGG